MSAIAVSTTGKATARVISRVYHKICSKERRLAAVEANIEPGSRHRSKRDLEIFFFSCIAFIRYKSFPEEFINPASRYFLLTIAVLALFVPSASADLFPASGPTVSGKTARLRFG